MIKINTKIDYLYRDASNYKSYQNVIISGSLTPTDIDTILACCQDHEYFIPEYLDIPAERNWGFDPEQDDAFWELDKTSFSETNERPTSNITPEQLVDRFKELKDQWDRLATEYPNLIE